MVIYDHVFAMRPGNRSSIPAIRSALWKLRPVSSLYYLYCSIILHEVTSNRFAFFTIYIIVIQPAN